MNCEEIKQQLGHYVDNELTSHMREEVSAHLKTCSTCSLEFKNLQDLTARISDSNNTRVPANLWDSIEQRLDTMDHPTKHTAPHHSFLRSRRWAMAASIIIVAGIGMFGLSLVDTQAKASTIDFCVLLDGLQLDARDAFNKFLKQYDAQPTTPDKAPRSAPSLNFATPPTLPGGFRLKSVFLLQFGNQPGVAASYERGDDFLAAIFHRPVEQENFGTHKDYPCVVGKHHGHKVEVGSWKMVHLTDPTTCHCVLSQLDETSEIPAIMAAVAPDAINAHTHNHR